MSADDAARQEAEQRYPFDAPDTYHSDAERMQRSVFIQGERTGWIDHAAWQREQPVTDAEVEAAARSLGVHRWKDIGVRHVSCECGEVLETSADQDILTEFPADEVFREHLARAALEAAKGASNG